MNSFRKEDKCGFIIKFLSAVQMNVLLNEGVVGCQFEKQNKNYFVRLQHIRYLTSWLLTPS